MSINTRDLADKAGAICGTATGLALGTFLFASGNAGDLTLNGEKIPQSPVINSAIFALTVGVCSNLCRNAAVGIHDTVKISFEAGKKIWSALSGCFRNSRVHNDQLVEPENRV